MTKLNVWRTASALLVFCTATAIGSNAQTFTLLYSFKGGEDGSFPYATLTLDSKGNLYGTTSEGGCGAPGCSGNGTAFMLTPTGTETVLHRFGKSGDGKGPRTGLVADAEGNGYGTTPGGGADGRGTAYELSRTGKETVVHSFGSGSDGWVPMDALTVNSGSFFGTASEGGGQDCNHGCGTVFKMDSAGNVTTLYEFTGTPDGYSPQGDVVFDPAGNIYGTTGGGGTYNQGTIFEVDAFGKETVLYSFNGTTDGSDPDAGLAWDDAGNLYGTTYGGGYFGGDCASVGCGTVFKFNPTTLSFSVLYSLAGQPDGFIPLAGVVVDKYGNLYGTTVFGGTENLGAIFEVDPSGKESVVYSFTGGADGVGPRGGLTLDAEGNLFGMTSGGGAYNAGTVFELSRSLSGTDAKDAIPGDYVTMEMEQRRIPR